MFEQGFTFIDLFAGIGGIRLAFESAGGKCAFASEWDHATQKTYEVNFNHLPTEIRRQTGNSVPVTVDEAIAHQMVKAVQIRLSPGLPTPKQLSSMPLL